MYSNFEDFYFNAQVWGTVSDWVMIAVTGVTAYYLYQTLKSQRKIQRMQQRITDIEDFKFRKSMMPRFEVKGEVPIYGRNVINTKYFLVLRDHEAKNIKVRIEAKTNKETIAFEKESKSLSPNFNLPFYFDLNVQYPEIHFEIILTVTFDDVAGNKYMQYAEIIKPNPRTQSYGERTEPSLIKSWTGDNN